MPNAHVLSASTAVDRQRLQAQVWERETEILFDSLDLVAGWECVDLGCGPMGALAPLSQRVGLGGAVVGVEPDPLLADAARDFLEQDLLLNTRIVEREILDSGLDRGRYDVVHARFLMAQIDPERLVDEMCLLARRGGLVIVQEPENSSWNFHPRDQAWQRMREILLEILGVDGDCDAGDKTWGIMRRAGLRDLQMRAAVLALPPNHPYMRLPIETIKSCADTIVERGIASADELVELITAVDALAHDTERIMISPVVTQVVGRV